MSEKNMMEKPDKGKKPATLAVIINSDSMKSQFAAVLPECLTADRLARVALTQLRKVPKLNNCSQGSFLSAMMTCAELGLEPNGRHIHLIPYGNECQVIVDYKGLVELAMRSGKISRIHADVVCENDRISIKNGIIDHEINPLKERGEMVGAYAMCAFKDGTEKHEYMSKSEIDAIRSRSKAGKSGPWVSDYNEMSKKTVFRRMSKWLPLSPEIMDTVEKEADRIEERSAFGTASSPVYSTPEIPEESPLEDAEGLNREDFDIDGNPTPVRDAPSVSNMKKSELLKEVLTYSEDDR